MMNKRLIIVIIIMLILIPAFSNENVVILYSYPISFVKPFTANIVYDNQTSIPYVIITIYNNQSTGTSFNFQEMLKIDWSLYSQFLNANCSNVRFYNSTNFIGDTAGYGLLPAWIESNDTNTSTSSIVWVNMSGTIIPAHDFVNIYMAFLPKSVTWSKYLGVAPTLTPKYGEYDNGVYVFSGYWNFSGTSLPSGWYVNSGPIVVNNGLYLYSAYQAATDLHTYASYNPQAYAMDVYGYDKTWTFGTYTVGFGFWWPSFFYAITNCQNQWSNNRGYALTNGELTYTWVYSTAYDIGGPNLNTLYLFSLWSNNQESFAQVNYSKVYSNNQDFVYTTNSNVFLKVNYWQPYVNSPWALFAYVQWVRVRVLPPNAVMPGFSISNVYFTSQGPLPNLYHTNLNPSRTQAYTNLTGIWYQGITGDAFGNVLWTDTAGNTYIRWHNGSIEYLGSPYSLASPAISNATNKIPITIYNTQNTSTPAPFQQRIDLNISNTVLVYSQTQFEGSYANFYFEYPNGTIIPAWIESDVNGILTIWLKLLYSIPPYSKTTIYIVYSKNKNYMSSKGPIGEAPELSTPYGEYDDGWKVFDFYYNFSGNGYANSIWQPVYAQSGEVNNGYHLQDSYPGWGGIYTIQHFDPQTQIVDYYAYVTQFMPCWYGGNDIFLGFGSMATLPYNGYPGYYFITNGYCYNQIPEYGLTNYDSSGNPAEVPDIGGPNINTLYVLSLWASKTASYAQVNYSTVYSNPMNFQQTTSSPIAIMADNTPTGVYVQWVRVRELPPNGIMPSYYIPYNLITYKNINQIKNAGPITSISAMNNPYSGFCSITITNSQNLPTPSPFQEMIQLNITQFPQLIYKNNYANFYFEYPNGTVIPAWIESDVNGTLTIWLKLLYSIPPYSNTLIRMVYSSNNYLSINGPIGEAPQLSNPYGKYDDGNLVFIAYWNFSGNSLPSGWYSTGKPVFYYKNGLTIVTKGGWSGIISTSSYNPQTEIVDFYGYSTSFSTSYNMNFGYNNPSSTTPYTLYAICNGNSGTEYGLVNYNPNNNAAPISVENNIGGSMPSTPYIFSIWSSNIASVAQVNYGQVYLNYGDVIATNSAPIDAYTAYPNIFLQWVRVRMLPPNNVMPSYQISSTAVMLTENGIVFGLNYTSQNWFNATSAWKLPLNSDKNPWTSVTFGSDGYIFTDYSGNVYYYDIINPVLSGWWINNNPGLNIVSTVAYYNETSPNNDALYGVSFNGNVYVLTSGGWVLYDNTGLSDIIGITIGKNGFIYLLDYKNGTYIYVSSSVAGSISGTFSITGKIPFTHGTNQGITYDPYDGYIFTIQTNGTVAFSNNLISWTYINQNKKNLFYIYPVFLKIKSYMGYNFYTYVHYIKSINITSLYNFTLYFDGSNGILETELTYNRTSSQIVNQANPVLLNETKEVLINVTMFPEKGFNTTIYLYTVFYPYNNTAEKIYYIFDIRIINHFSFIQIS